MNNEKYTIALYRIAREGQSTGHVKGLGRTPKQWDKKQIRQLADKINEGIPPDCHEVPVYLGHDPNNKVDRKQIGYVLAAFSAFIEGSQDAFAVIIINDPWTVAKIDNNLFNIASIEADLTLEAEDEAGWKVTEIENVTGIALASDETHTPGFRSARLITTVHEMDDPERPTTNDQLPSPAFPADIDGGGVHWSPLFAENKIWCRAYAKIIKLCECREDRERFNRTGGYLPEGCFDCHWREIAERPSAKRDGPPEGSRVSDPGGSDLVNCPALQIDIFRRLCQAVQIVKHSNPFPQCNDCPVRST